MDVVVAFLVGWAVNKARRVGQRADERVDQAVDMAVDHVWAVLAAKLGANPVLGRLRTDAALNGMVATDVRTESERLLEAAASQDPWFAHELRTAVLEAMSLDARRQPALPQPVHNPGGSYVGSVVAGGSVKINQRVVNYARTHPLPFTLIILAVVVVLAGGGYGLVAAVSGNDSADLPAGSAESRNAVLATGSNSACGVRNDNTVVCWKESVREFSAPSGPFTSIAVTQNVACGLRQDRTVTCWDADPQFTSTGAPADAPAQVPSPQGQFTAIGAGCGLRDNHSIECWFDDLTDATIPSGEFTTLSIGMYGTACALTTAGKAECWLGDESTTSPPPDKFTALSVGGYHVCGLREDTHIVCWGKNDEGQASPPPGEFTAVTTGEEHTCGLRADGSVKCWGRGKDGQTSPPHGKFVGLGVGTGGEYTCGVRSNGKAECWGRGGKMAPPPLQLLTGAR